MKGYHVSRSLSQHSAGPCHCMPEDAAQQQVELYRRDHHYYPPGGPPEPLGGGGTFPRSHPVPSYDSCEECVVKGPRIPAGLLDQFEKQLPYHPDGFHTLPYQHAGGPGEHRSESPGRIRHLVHSVQRLFAKSHSLEAPSKREVNGSHRDVPQRQHPAPPVHQRPSRSARRSKSRERSKSGEWRHGHRHRSRTAGWWSSDDNLDSDSSFLISGGGGARGQRGGAEGLEASGSEVALRKGKSAGECLACNVAVGDAGHSLKRSTWSSMTVSQAREVFPQTHSSPYDKALVPLEPRMKERSLQYLQVPSEDWAVADSRGEIPCRRMRSGSYIKAMGDDESGDSDASPRTSPKTAIITQREALRRSVSVDQRANAKFSCRQCTDAYLCSRSAPKGHARSRSYTRSLTSSQLGDSLSRQFESVCESVFGEAESQAVEALDLPGCFRTRSHSYVRAIQAGCTQDDDCLSVFSMSSTKAGSKGAAVFPYRKLPPALPPRVSKPLISVAGQSSTESTHDTYFQNTGQPAPRPKQHSNSLDALDVPSGRSSRAAYYTKPHSNSVEGLEGPRAPRVRGKHSSSADNLLEVAGRVTREHPGVPLGKSPSLPHSVTVQSVCGSEDTKQESRRGRWRPSIAVQVDSSETISDSDTESRTLREVHSVGIQVEEDKRRARFKRSNSVTASVQADLDPEGFPVRDVPTQDKGLQFGCSFQRHSSEPESAGPYGEYRTVHTQGQWSYRQEHTPQQPRPQGVWSEGPRSLPDSGRASPCVRDGELFLRLLQSEVERMEGWCHHMEREAEENELPGEVVELIRSAVGSAQLLMSQKVQQFFRLCQQSLDPTAFPQPTSQDLASLWDLLQAAVEDVRVQFQELQRMKDSGWRLSTEKKEDKKPPPLLPKKAGVGGAVGGACGDILSAAVASIPGVLVMSRGGRAIPLRERSLELGDQRRLLQAKRSTSFRQNSATESADSIEIYIPEAQTRL